MSTDNPLNLQFPEIHTPPEGPDAATQFATEMEKTVARYMGIPGATADFGMTNALGAPISLSEAFPQEFEEWKEIHTLWDRRRHLYTIIDRIIGDSLTDAQMAERWILAREAEHALKILKSSDTDSGEDADFCAAFAHVYTVLCKYEQAETWAGWGLEIDPMHRNCRLRLADVWHITGRHEEAHAKWFEVAGENIPQDQEVSLHVNELFSFSKNIAHSPIFAIGMLGSSQEVQEFHWELAATEFYHSPHFRAEHAYWLLQNGGPMGTGKGLSKLLVITQEMPWFKEAVLNCMSILEQFGMKDRMTEHTDRLERLIAENGWSTSGMHSRDIRI